MKSIRTLYKVLRSLLFTVIISVVGIYAILYIALSIPFVQNEVKERVEKEASAFLKSRVAISDIDIMPFNEVRLHGVEIFDPSGKKCVSVARLGAGISLWQLIASGRIIVNYAELIGLYADIRQPVKDAPLNIDFIIRAFAKKDNKPSAPFDVSIRNIVIRKSGLAFNREWLPAGKPGMFDSNHIRVEDLRADIELPRLKNDDFTVDIRRLAFREQSGLDLESLSLLVRITPHSLDVRNLKVRLAESEVNISDISLKFNGYKDILPSLKRGDNRLHISGNDIMPSEFAPFLPQLKALKGIYSLQCSIAGNVSDLTVENFSLSDESGDFDLLLEGAFKGLGNPSASSGNIDRLSISCSESSLGNILSLFPDDVRNSLGKVSALGSFGLDLKGDYDLASKKAKTTLFLESGAGNISADGNISWADRGIASQFKVSTDAFDVSSLVKDSPVGILTADMEGAVAVRNGDISGNVKASVPSVEYLSDRIDNINLELQKAGEEIRCIASVNDELARLDLNLDGVYSPRTASSCKGSLNIGNLDLSLLRLKNVPGDAILSGVFDIDASGSDLASLAGSLDAGNIIFRSGGKELNLNSLRVSAGVDGAEREYALTSDFINGSISGSFSPVSIVPAIRNLISRAVPAFVTPVATDNKAAESSMAFRFTLNPDDRLFSMLSLPMRPGVPVEIYGGYSGGEDALNIHVDAPYLVQGKNKLIKDTHISAELTGSAPAKIAVATDYPLKNDRAITRVDLAALNNDLDLSLGWKMNSNEKNKGKISLNALLERNLLDRSLEARILLADSGFELNGADWKIDGGNISFKNKTLEVDDVRIWHLAQFIEIAGKASDRPEDVLAVDLAGIDLSYIFDILNINYVNFGGIATGRVLASSLFSRNPYAATERLFVKNLAYNGCVVGDGDLSSHYDNERKMVAIHADIVKDPTSSATVDGGVWVTRDSLSFDFDAKKVNVGLLAPFMSGFTSSVTGKATGHVKLYGTFSDIDLGGWAYADSITMLVDQTNVRYIARDSVFFTPGKISLPHVRIYDRYGNSGMLSGTVRHNYLHDPSFNFELKDARDLLVYDTDRRFNPKWYGRVFGSGSASIRGVPGFISLGINLATSRNSDFTFVLEETLKAEDYTFLTFSDKRKEQMLEVKENLTFEDEFTKEMNRKQEDESSLFSMNLMLDVNPGATVNIIMDPKAGDKITATGNGALQISYDSDSDDMLMYGKYTLDRGNYNFSLQDLILKDFKIESGSNIAFNGDPMRGVLDITASYRVNTNITDLDASFLTDPDLNRTSVPVDALLNITGDIHQPEIKFDIKLPTVTAEVERKVRSIISTEDMMNRQVIYLLALNRFYSPEYMGSGQGGELASVASSTLSSQISNIIGSITDKFSLSPSFKSDRNDFSDVEVDVALSSSLFNNRLLINGNLGYRDKSTSQTTFIGDFDLEYLLSRDGRLRLKAYNHFNDASYYLKSSLTTQGVGIIYRKDFDDAFKFLRKKKKKSIPLPKDSLQEPKAGK